jgi:gas vesicle protein
MKTEKLILAMIGAATAGVIAGMLIAPEKGSALRRKLTERTGNFACSLGDTIEKGISQFNKIKSELADQVAGLEISSSKTKKTDLFLSKK